MATNPSTPPPASALLRDDLAERPQRARPIKASESPDPSQDLRLEALRRLELAELESQEPDCMCIQTDVDLLDARGCPLHDSGSEWNVAMRRVSTIEEYERYEPMGPQDCPF